MKNLPLTILFVILLTPQVHISQNVDDLNKKFDSIYFETATNIAGRNINLAIQIADSLYNHSVSDLHKIKSLMLSSTLYGQKGENEESLDYALLAEKMAENAKVYDWQARISGFLSTQYRKIGLYNKGRVYLEKGIETSKKILDEPIRNLYLGMVYQESAYYDIYDNKYTRAEKFVMLAEEQFNKLSDGVNKNYFLATNKELYGRVYLNLEKYDAAYTNYYEAIALLENIIERDAFLNGFVYSGLGRVYFVRGDYENAYKYLTLAEQIAEKSDLLNLKLEVYKTLSDYFNAVGDSSCFLIYNEKFYEVSKLKELNKNKYINNFVYSIEQENQVLLTNRNFLIVAFISLIFTFIFVSVFYKRKNKKEFERFKSVIASLKQKDSLLKTEKTLIVPKKNDRKNIMSTEMEERILNDLQKFEESKRFTNKDMSISVLAGLLKTNTKYLSHVLNVHKNKDFNNYINTLRINYIINKLETEKEFRKYKISYLADKCGFSSHSKFTNVFKSVTSFTPSVFIEFIEKDKKENPTKTPTS